MTSLVAAGQDGKNPEGKTGTAQSGFKNGLGRALETADWKPALRSRGWFSLKPAGVFNSETDTLSTALLTVGLEGHEQIARLRPGMRTLVAARAEIAGQFRVEVRGIEVRGGS